MKNKIQHSVSVLTLGLFVFMAFGSMDDEKSSDNTTGTATSFSETEIKKAEDSETPKENWRKTESEDKMEGTKRYFATSTSTNQIEFEFPYNGGSTFSLIVRNMGKGNEVLMTVSKGQFMTSFSGSETIKMKFDDEKPFNVSYNSADDASMDVIFFNSSNKILTKLKSANKLMIEAPFYDAGRQIIYFDVSGLEWEK